MSAVRSMETTKTMLLRLLDDKNLSRKQDSGEYFLTWPEKLRI